MQSLLILLSFSLIFFQNRRSHGRSFKRNSYFPYQLSTSLGGPDCIFWNSGTIHTFYKSSVRAIFRVHLYLCVCICICICTQGIGPDYWRIFCSFDSFLLSIITLYKGMIQISTNRPCHPWTAWRQVNAVLLVSVKAHKKRKIRYSKSYQQLRTVSNM